MQGGKPGSAYNSAVAIGPALFCLLAAACTPSGGSSLATGVAGNPAPTIPGIMAEVASQDSRTPASPQPGGRQASVAGQTAPQSGAAVPTTPATALVSSAAAQTATPNGDAVLPDQVKSVPTPSPAEAVAATPQAAPAAPVAERADANAGGTSSDTAVQAVMASVAAPVPMPRPAVADESAQPAAASAVTAFAAPAKPAQPPKRGFFAVLFGGASTAQKPGAPQQASSPPAQPAPSPTLETAAIPTPSPSPIPQGGIKPLIDARAPAKPLVQLASVEPQASPLVASGPARSLSESDNALPGVRSQSSLFEITRKSGTGDDSDVDISEDDNEPVRVASAGGLARLDPHGLLLQRQTVETACLKPGLVSILKQIEQHFGHKLIVTSGYRSPVHNAAAHGALNSLHMFCAAADVQMPGVSKWQLADYARSLPGRGGVGTYCYTDSVHIDIGPERDWNWRCRRRRRR